MTYQKNTLKIIENLEHGFHFMAQFVTVFVKIPVKGDGLADHGGAVHISWRNSVVGADSHAVDRALENVSLFHRFS
jgi:hypothetical protein